MGEKEEKTKEGEEEITLFPSTKKKKEGFFSRLFHPKPKEQKEEDKQEPRPLLEDIPKSNHFILSTGKNVKNIPQMVEELKAMSDEEAKSHITEERNDIANWIQDVFQDPYLAKKILKAKKKKKIIKLLEKEMKKTERKFKEMKEKLQKEELEKPPEKPPEPIKELDVTAIKLPIAPKMLEVKLEKPLQKLGETLSPPTPPVGFFKKKKGANKTKEEQKEIDKLITFKEEKSRFQKKRSLLGTQEKAISEKERKLFEQEESHKRALQNIENRKKAADYDVRERLTHIREKEKGLNEKKLKLEKDKKCVEEKDELLDKLRKKYLDTIAKEKSLEEKDQSLNKKETDLKKNKEEIKKIKTELNQKFNALKSEESLESKWNSKFITFNNLKNQLEIREREIKPVLSRFEDDLQLLTQKEKVIIDTIKRLESDEKLLLKEEENVVRNINDLQKKEERTKQKFNQIKQKEADIKKKEKIINQRERKVKKDQEKVINVKEIRANIGKLKAELRTVEKALVKKSNILLDIPQREDELKKVEEELLRKKSGLEKKEEGINKKKEELSNKEKKYEEEMDELMDEEFHRYLQKSLSHIEQEVPKKEEKSQEYLHNEIYVLIDNCRSLIESKEFSEAKKVYNNIRQKFIGLGIEGTEKEMLQNTIKELYQEINMATISQ